MLPHQWCDLLWFRSLTSGKADDLTYFVTLLPTIRAIGSPTTAFLNGTITVKCRSLTLNHILNI
jgi:hypothetical protein